MQTLWRLAAMFGAVLLAAGAGSAFAQGRVAQPGGMCGGIAGIQCPAGQACAMTGPPVADEAGVCTPVKPAPGGHMMCPQIFQPVCGTDGRTYPNRCTAGSRGATVAHAGECGIAPPPYPSQPGPPPPQICPDIFQPVCGRDGRTYPNRCIARANGARIRHRGACSAPHGYTPVSPPSYGLPPAPVPYGSYPPPQPYGERG